MPGPLSGLRIVEFAGVGPGPFCGMMLADQGAQVIRLERPEARFDQFDILARSRECLTVDVKNLDGLALARELCRGADGLIEGYRPGVMERLGLGPDLLLADNPRLVYGRITGWGQTGPLAGAAGHDINYIGLTGVLHTVGVPGEKPVVPVNYVGDFGGGGMLLAFGMAAALLAVARGGAGQIVDAAMAEGAALLSAMTWQFRARGMWSDVAGTNLLDGGAHFYGTYECADGRHIAIGAVEPQFYRLLLDLLGLKGDPAFESQRDEAAWPEQKRRLGQVFATRTRGEWCDLIEGTDACFAPVLTLGEAPAHPHNAFRQTFITVADQVQPAPAPRFSSAPADTPRAPLHPESQTDATLAKFGFAPARIAALRAAGAVR